MPSAMMYAALICLFGASVAIRAPNFDGTADFIDAIKSKADSVMGELVARAGGRDPLNTDPTAPPDHVEFDEAFFREKCDMSEYQQESFDEDKYKYSATQEVDSSRWLSGRKCEDPQVGAGFVVREDNFQGTNHGCAQSCNAYTEQNKGKVICCMFDQDRKQCHGFEGWQGMSSSAYGTNQIFKWFNRRNPKQARLMFTPVELGDGDLTGDIDAVNNTQEGQDFVKDLIHQVNAVSIDGILDHLLSFYVCIRWVPDAEFIRLARFELEHVSVDAETPAEGPGVTRENIMEKVLKAGLMPLRCNSAVNVQHIPNVDKLLAEFNNTESDMYQLYTFARKIWSVTDGGLLNGLFNDEMRALNDALKWDGTQDRDSVFVQDMRQVARKKENLPWVTFLRSSNAYSHHFSSSDNLFMICFGPRVASFPHKRENGGHILADGNMAGCNGMWDWPTMTEQMNRIKKLFAPEMCFEHTLRKELKDKFLATFVEMNEEFELAMQNKFAKRVHELDPTTNSALDVLTDRVTAFDKASALSNRQTGNAYRKIAGLVANAGAKWVLCPAKPGSGTAAFGNEDNFFRNPKAYEKWIGEVVDETVPQCKTPDPTTGCVKCVVAVMDEYRCHVRLNVQLTDVFKAIRDGAYPFLRSRFTVEEEVETERGPALRSVTKQGACMVRKSVATSVKAQESGDMQDVRDAYFNVNDTDTVVNLMSQDAPPAGGNVDSELRFPVSQRKRAYEQWIADGGIYDPSVTERLIGAVTEEQYRDKDSNWPKKYIFTHDEPEEQNRPAHKVDYFMSCPCTVSDFAPSTHFAQFGGIGMGEYYNFR